MCGLVVTTDMEAFGPRGWQAAQDVLATRGPDATGTANLGPVHMAHKRLAIIGLGEAGAQPMHSDPDHLLVFNGEIYNYRELAQTLGIRADSDTQVVYEMCRRGLWERLSELRGMYAFVHYDARTERITAARDPFGIKPLYTRTFRDGGLAFGSTAAAVASAEESKTVDTLSLLQFLAVGYFSSGTSPWLEIQKVPPATVSQWGREGHSWVKHWSRVIGLPASRIEDPIAALEDSVEAHLVADVEVGILMSGGVDSTLLAALASQRHTGIRTFTITNPRTPAIDESRYARHNARLLGTDHLEVPVDPSDLAPRALPLIRSTGEPFSDAAYLPLSALSEMTSQHVKVALAGEGADELFGGYRRYDFERFVEHRTIGRPLRLGARALVPRHLREAQSQLSRAAYAATLPSLPERHAALMFDAWDVLLDRYEGLGRSAFERWTGQWECLPQDAWALGQVSYRAHDTRLWLPNVFLEKSDRASMLHSLEVRTPFLDKVVAWPLIGSSPRNSTKPVLRKRLLESLPDVLLPTAKKGLAVDTASLTSHAYADDIISAITDPQSIVTKIGGDLGARMLRAARARPALAFRLAMLHIWQVTWMPDGF